LFFYYFKVCALKSTIFLSDNGLGKKEATSGGRQSGHFG